MPYSEMAGKPVVAIHKLDHLDVLGMVISKVKLKNLVPLSSRQQSAPIKDKLGWE